MENKTALTLLVLFVHAAYAHAAVITDADWPIPGHDLYHSGYSSAASKLDIADIGLLHFFEQKGELSSPVTADINGDGKAEILVGSTDNNLYALTWEAKEIWRFAAGGEVGAPAVYDLALDNTSEILFASKDGKIYAVDANGSLLWSYQTNGSVSTTPVALNMNYKPELEVVCASDDKYLYVLDYAGNKLKSYLIADPLPSTPCVGDVNLDGKPDYFMGAYNNKMNGIISPESRRMSFDTTGPVTTPVYIQSASGNTPRIIIAGGDGKVYSLMYEESTRIDEGTNEVIKISSYKLDWQYNVSGEVSSSPALSDLDRDGLEEIIVGSRGKVLYILDSDGKILEKHTVNGKIIASPVSADLDGDGYPEIIFGSSDGLFSILNNTGYRKWSYDSGRIISKDAAVSDLDRDGNLEILLSAGNKLYVFGEKKSNVKETTTTSSTSTSSTSAKTTTSTSTTSTTSQPPTTTTLIRVTTTTNPREQASVGFNDFILFLVALIGMFVVVGIIAKALHHGVTKEKAQPSSGDAAGKDRNLHVQSPAGLQTPVAERTAAPASVNQPPVSSLSAAGDKTLPKTSAVEGRQADQKAGGEISSGAVAKLLQEIYTRQKRENIYEKNVQTPKENAPAPKVAISQTPLIAAEEKTVEEYRKALQALIDKEKTLPAQTHSENTLPALDDEHREFLDDLKALEKESKKKASV